MNIRIATAAALSVISLLPPKPGLKATAAFQGLPGATPVSLQFR